MSEHKQDPGFELKQRLPAVCTLLPVLFLLELIPGRIRIFPHWVFYVLGAGMLLPMVMAGVFSRKAWWMAVERNTILVVCAIATVVILANLTALIRSMIIGSKDVSSVMLLSSSVSVWITNVLIFTLVYWQIDRGGPLARHRNIVVKPDWHFPAQDLPAEVGPDWRPTFIDYLFMGFSTAAAFSMTEAAPLTPRAKILMMAQSSISLVTLVVVGARAINILGS